MTRDSFGQALIAEFVSAVEAVLGNVSASATTDTPAGEGWLLRSTASGDLRGTIDAWIDRAGSEALAQRVMGMDEAPDAATVSDMLREMWQQAAGSLSLKDPFTGVKLAMGTIEAAPAATGLAVTLTAGDCTALVTIGGNAVGAPPQVVAPQAPAKARVPELVPNDTLDAVLDMELPLVVRFARTVMPLKELAALGPGSLVDMERSPDEPVQMLVGDRVIARGEVVVVGGHYGVRVTELVSASERARAMEA